jgi:hypothetical protein
VSATYAYVYMYIYLYLHMHGHICASQPTNFYLSIYVPIFVPLSLCIYIPMYTPICLRSTEQRPLSSRDCMHGLSACVKLAELGSAHAEMPYVTPYPLRWA